VKTILELTRQLLSERVRSSQPKLRELLHPEFVEFSASGNICSRARMIATAKPLEEKAQVEPLGHTRLGPDTLLLRWRLRGHNRASLRSSVWVRDADGNWQLLFEQGTPVNAG
jgi:ribonuclease HI